MSLGQARRPACRVTSGFHGGAVVFHVQGELVAESGPVLITELAQAVGEVRVLLELSGVTCLDTNELGTLLEATRAIRQAGGQVAVAVGRGAVEQTLRLGGMRDIAFVTTSAEAALNWLMTPDRHPAGRSRR